MLTCQKCTEKVNTLISQHDGALWCESCDLTHIHQRIKGMPIYVGLVPAQIAALAAAAEFIIDNGGFPDNEELTEHLRNGLKALGG